MVLTDDHAVPAELLEPPGDPAHLGRRMGRAPEAPELDRSSATRRHAFIVTPPPTLRCSPATNSPSEHRNRTPAATARGAPSRPSGIRRVSLVIAASAASCDPNVYRSIGVSI